MGHGVVDAIPCVNKETSFFSTAVQELRYLDLIGHIVNSANT